MDERGRLSVGLRQEIFVSSVASFFVAVSGLCVAALGFVNAGLWFWPEVNEWACLDARPIESVVVAGWVEAVNERIAVFWAAAFGVVLSLLVSSVGLMRRALWARRLFVAQMVAAILGVVGVLVVYVGYVEPPSLNEVKSDMGQVTFGLGFVLMAWALYRWRTWHSGIRFLCKVGFLVCSTLMSLVSLVLMGHSTRPLFVEGHHVDVALGLGRWAPVVFWGVAVCGLGWIVLRLSSSTMDGEFVSSS